LKKLFNKLESYVLNLNKVKHQTSDIFSKLKAIYR